MAKNQRKIFVGIDEVGRGPLAGPVAVGVFVSFFGQKPKELFGIRDSKKLNDKQKWDWYKKIIQLRRGKVCDFSVKFCSAKYIDKNGITKAIQKALYNALKSLKLNPKKVYVLLDGGLKAPLEFKNQKTIIKGDDKEPVISAASIVAKVTRDKHMVNLSKKYPNYGFEKHKGYGTRLHIKSIHKSGLCIEHRRTFLKNIDC